MSAAACVRRAEVLGRYYRLHARIYDATRWSFLFGRRRLLEAVAAGGRPRGVLEVGCGTGANLAWMAGAWPSLRLAGIDTSEAMLEVARRKLEGVGARVDLQHGYYDRPHGRHPAPDLILFSYCLSMIGDPLALDAVLAAAAADLAPGGRLAVVDFHDSGRGWFRDWMACNHVRMDAGLLERLQAGFGSEWSEVRGAYFGTWRWFCFVGRKAGGADDSSRKCDAASSG